jgi:histidine ammonia-lyase
VLIGEGEAEYLGETLPAGEALARAGSEPVTLAAKEGLALTNGTTVMTAVGVLETVRARKMAAFADVSGCLTLEALHGTVSAFDERIHALRPHPRQIECAKNLREILSESDLVRDFDPANVQDAYTLRCMPQVHGACRDAVLYAEWLLKLELNAVTDNPLIFTEGEKIEVLSGGNFHGEPLALAFDYLTIALAELGNISERRIMRLTDEHSNEHILPPFLTEHGGLNSGFMIVQYTAAALCTENKILAHPASVDTIPSSANVEDHVSMGATAALKLRLVAENLENILSLELLCAGQGVDFRRKALSSGAQLGIGTRGIYEQLRRSVPFVEKDEYMKTHIDSALRIVREWKNSI